MTIRWTQQRSLRTLADLAAAALSGPGALAKEALDQALERLTPDQRRAGVEESLKRVEEHLRPFWRIEGRETDDQLVWETVLELFEKHALSVDQVARLDARPRAIAEEVLRNGRAVLDQLDGRNAELCQSAVHFVYAYLLDDEDYLAECEPAIYRALLGRLSTFQRKVDDHFAAATREREEIIHHLRLAVGVSEPAWETPEQRELGERLEALCERRASLAARDAPVPSGLREEILDLERRLRDGPELPPGFVFNDRFQLRAPIGSGGFATVWLAYDRVQREIVAVKVLHGQFSRDRSRRSRFFAGARQMARLQLDHDGIVRVIEPRGRHGQYFYFVMEYAAGGDLERAVLRDTLTREEALDKVLAVGEALEEAHRHGMIHRDVKPSNILLTADGSAKLTDFDLVKAEHLTGGTRSEMGMGSLAYTAPEVAGNAKDADRAADIYSFAMTIAFVLHGLPLPIALPWHGTEDFLSRLNAPVQLQSALIKATHPEADRRWQSVIELIETVERARGMEARKSNAGRRTTAADRFASKRPKPIDIIDTVEVTVPRLAEPDRPGAVLDLVNRVLPIDARPFHLLATLVWALDYFPGRSQSEDERAAARRLRDKVMAPLRHAQPPPPQGYLPLVDIPAGHFTIGSPRGARTDGHPAHEVSVSAFRLASVPVTNSAFQLLQPSELGPGKLPLLNVDWYTAYAFAAWLGGRLPTEAEWEYACRAGSSTDYWSGDSEADLARVGWYNRNSKGRLHPVGEKPANPWGLHDMHGLVTEWMADWYAGYESTVQSDPWGPPRGHSRVTRGGSCGAGPHPAKSASRFGFHPWNRWRFRGFRILLPARS